MNKLYVEKKRLLLELKKEALNQLSAVQTEDPEGFLQSTETCDSIIEELNAIQLESTQPLGLEETELRKILQDIAALREQISSLIPQLYENIRRKSVTEKQTNLARSRYNHEDYPLPSIFLDKKL